MNEADQLLQLLPLGCGRPIIATTTLQQLLCVLYGTQICLLNEATGNPPPPFFLVAV